MAVAAIERTAGPYTCTGGETIFPFAFDLIDDGDVIVWRKRAGVLTQLVQNSHYVVEYTGAGGHVRLLAAALAADEYAVDGARPMARESDLSQGRAWKEQYINGELDSLQSQALELRRDVDRALRRPAIGSPYSAGGRRLADLAEATEPNDAVRLVQLQGLVTPVVANAAASAAAAATSASAAATSAAAAADAADDVLDARDQTVGSYVDPSGSPTVIFEHVLLDDISGNFNGSATVFNLRVGGQPLEPNSAAALVVHVDGIYQRPGAAYTVDGSQITLTFAPTAGTEAAIVALKNTYGVASDIAFAPEGDIAAVTVQEAIEELDTEKQPRDATLTAMAGLVLAANKIIYGTGPDAAALADLTAYARTLLACTDATAALGVLTAAPLNSPAFTGTPTVPNLAANDNSTKAVNSAYVDAARDDLRSELLGGAPPAAINAIFELAAALGDDPNFATTMATALGNRLRVDATQGLSGGQKLQGQQNLDLVPGTNIQAFSAILASLAGQSLAANKLPYGTNANTFGLADFTAFARTLLDDADATAARGTLAIATVACDSIAGSFDGSATTFNLTASAAAVTPRSAACVRVIFNGVPQAPGDAFTISGSQITFTFTPATGDECSIVVANA